jgi:predicted ATPase
MIRRVSPETQVIVSTQSSPLLDHFQPEDVLVALEIGLPRMRRQCPHFNNWLARRERAIHPA